MDNLELYKQQGLDLFKLLEIAIPQKKTEPVLQVGNEINYKKIVNTHDSKYIICCAYSQTALIHIREVPSAKCILEHRFDAFLDEMSDLTIDGVAIIQLQGGQNYVVKFPEGEILHAFNGTIYDLTLCPDKKSFLFRIENEYFLYKSSNNIIRFDGKGRKIKEVHISCDMFYVLICYEYDIDLFSLLEGKTLYSIHEGYKFFDASISSDSCYFIYSVRNSSKDGYLKVIELLTGRLVDQHSAILYAPEFMTFSGGWIFNAGKMLVYYPATKLIKELSAGYITKAIAETSAGKYLLLIDSYRDKDYEDWNKFVVYNIDRLYNSNGEPEPVKRVDYKARFSDMRISPDKRLVSVCYPSKAIEFYSMGDFKTLAKIDIDNDNSINMGFSNCSSYFILSYRNQLLIYNTHDFSLINKPLTALTYYYYSKEEGLIALTNSLNAIQIRRVDDGSIVRSIPQERLSYNAFAVSNSKVWIKSYNGNYYVPEAIDLQSGVKKVYDTKIYHLKQVEGHFTICSLGIINTQTGELIPNAQVNSNFDDSYLYSFPKYSVKVNNFAIEVFENRTGLLVKKIAPPDSYKFGYSLTCCGDFIIYELENASQTYIESILDNTVPVQLFNHPIRLIEKIDERYFLITNYRINPNITDVYIFDTQQLGKPFKELALEGNLYTSTCNAQTQQIALNDSKICWFIDLKNPDNTFSIKEERNLGAMLFDHVMIKISEGNKLQYYNTSVNNVFKIGELLATLYTIPNGFLWTIPPDEASPYGWFWTDKPEYIEVMQYINKKNDYELLSRSSPERQKYIELHNRKDLVMARLHNPDEYKNILANLQGKIQVQQLQQLKHTLMLGS